MAEYAKYGTDAAEIGVQAAELAVQTTLQVLSDIGLFSENLPEGPYCATARVNGEAWMGQLDIDSDSYMADLTMMSPFKQHFQGIKYVTKEIKENNPDEKLYLEATDLGTCSSDYLAWQQVDAKAIEIEYLPEQISMT